MKHRPIATSEQNDHDLPLDLASAATFGRLCEKGCKPDQAKKALNRLASTLKNFLRSGSERPGLRVSDQTLASFSLPALAAAVDTFETPGDGLAVIFEEDLNVLMARFFAAEYLYSCTTPVCSLQELQHHFEQFILYLQADREHIISTGLSRQFYLDSPWLFSCMANLYNLRQTDVCFPLPQDNCQPSDTPYRFLKHNTCEVVFEREAIESVSTDFVLEREADLLPFVSPLAAERVQNDRARLFDIKVAILKNCADAVRHRSARQLWDDCLRSLTERLCADEAHFYIELDRCYDGTDVQSRVALNTRFPSHGGLSEWLELIGHMIEEVQTGVFARISEELGTSMQSGWNEGRIPRFRYPGVAYFALVRKFGKSTIDKATDTFVSAKNGLQNHWLQFRERVATALADEFSTVVRIEKKVKVKHANLFQRQIQLFADFTGGQLELTGDLPELTLGAVNTPSASATDHPLEARNSIRFDGKDWVVEYQGSACRLKDGPGIFYIGFLIQRADKAFTPAELRAAYIATKPKQSRSQGEYGEDHAVGAFSGRGLTNLGVTMDRLALEKLREKICENTADLDRARCKNNDEAEINRLEAEKAMLVEYLRKATRPDGVPRKLRDELKRDRDQVRNALDHCLNTIHKKSESFHKHLKASLRRGSELMYAPEHPIQWKF